MRSDWKERTHDSEHRTRESGIQVLTNWRGDLSTINIINIIIIIIIMITEGMDTTVAPPRLDHRMSRKECGNTRMYHKRYRSRT